MRSYNEVTRLMVLDDGSLFIHLTLEQAQMLAVSKPSLKVWVTKTAYIQKCESDIYSTRKYWENTTNTLSTALVRHGPWLSIADESICVPIEEYNHPTWGELSP